jgi:hypothetical protein
MPANRAQIAQGLPLRRLDQRALHITNSVKLRASALEASLTRHGSDELLVPFCYLHGHVMRQWLMYSLAAPRAPMMMEEVQMPGRVLRTLSVFARVDVKRTPIWADRMSVVLVTSNIEWR